MKKLEHKLLPCVFCTIGLNCYVVGHNLVYAGIQKLSNTNTNIQNKPNTITKIETTDEQTRLSNGALKG